MISMRDKTTTYRTASATAQLHAKPEAIARMQANDVPKKDVLVVARVAGVTAAKKTADLVPYCHPLPLDGVSIEFNVHEDHIEVVSTVEAVWKTGVEMEALMACSTAALTIYDMLKAIDSEMEITGTRLIEKRGGKSDFKEYLPTNFKAAVLVASDSTYAGNRQDKSGQIIKDYLAKWQVTPTYEVLPDDASKIAAQLYRWCEEGVHLIVTTGGTGLGPRDVTVEATREVIEREIPGVMEAIRDFGQSRTPYAMLSRGLAGQRGKTIIINLPGSSGGTKEGLAAVFPGIFHAYKMMRGEGH